MVSIYCKYHGPTNYQGSRISAQANGHRVYIPYPYELNIGEDAHRAAAEKLCDKLDWDYTGKFRLIGGCLTDTKGQTLGYTFNFEVN